MNSKKCYWCGKHATTKEHVPPKCLFPEHKDISQLLKDDFRKNLITVPSCDRHNYEKSDDDEYLLSCLAGKVGNNSLAFFHTKTKLKRVFEKRKNILKIEDEGVLKVKDVEFPVFFTTIDFPRLIRSFEAIARGLYFFEYGTQFSGKCVKFISTLFLNPQYKKSSSFIFKSINLIDKEKKQWISQPKGNNPKVFTYQFGSIDDFKNQILVLTFYENSTVYVVLSKSTKEDIDIMNKYKFIAEYILDLK